MTNNHPKKKVLIFYSKTGGGHLRAAEAIAQYLKEAEPNLEICLYDGLETTNFGFKTNPAKSFTLLSGKLLPLFNTFYVLTNNRLGIKLLRFSIKNIWGESLQKIINQENPDLIISTHHFISPQTIKRNSRPFITVVTDLGIPHRIWFDKNSQLLLTPTERILNQALKTIGTKKNILNAGYPLNKTFISFTNSPQIQNTILLLGGGSGSGKLKSQAQHLLKNLPEYKIIAICGFNKNLKNDLLKLNAPNLQIHGFVDNVHEYMKAADIIVGKAGPGTIAEAASLGKPLIITDWVGLQEKGNVDFVLDNHLGIYCPKVNKLDEAIKLIYKSYSNYSNPKKLLSPNLEKITQAIFSQI